MDNENVYHDAVLWRHTKSKMADGRLVKNRLFGHNSSPDCPISAKFYKTNQNGMTKTANIENSRWRMAAILVHNSRYW